MDTPPHFGVHLLRSIALFVVFVCLPAQYASAQSSPAANNESSVTRRIE
jgi:hypothetical protein